MNERPFWESYVAANGGPTGVSEKLGIPYSTIAGVCNGSRGIGRELAKRMAEQDPLLDATRLVWVRPHADDDKVLGNQAA